MTAFDDSFAELHGEEGDLSTDPNDPGNWTGGAVGVGENRGTNFGISAAAYPTLDIAHLTLEQAKAIAKRDFWDPLHCDDLPFGVAHALFDTAFNQGVGAAARLFQHAVGVAEDGIVGSGTMAAFRRAGPRLFARRFTVARIVRYSHTRGWELYADGWVGRALDSYGDML
jgi:lysozyme family protein